MTQGHFESNALERILCLVPVDQTALRKLIEAEHSRDTENRNQGCTVEDTGGSRGELQSAAPEFRFEPLQLQSAYSGQASLRQCETMAEWLHLRLTRGTSAVSDRHVHKT